MRSIDPRKWDAVVNGSPALRKAICRQDPMYFAMYYFPQYFKYKNPEFHYDLYNDCKDLTDGSADEIMWCIFRDSAKTSIAKIALLTWVICYKLKANIKWDSYEQDSGENALFDITIALQTNKRIIHDFGQLYYKKKEKNALVEAQRKQVKNFITENGISVSTLSTQEASRSKNAQAENRTDLYIIDDFENFKTVESPPTTNKVIKHLDEIRSGLPAGASILYLCNYISDTGSVAYIMDKLKGNPRSRVRMIPVENSKGEIAWPDKFVKTTAEAIEINKTIPDIKRHKIALEDKEKALGTAVYQTEYMLNPAKAGDLFFDRRKVDAAIEKAIDPLEKNGDLFVWEKFSPLGLYGGGADTSEGIGGDSNTSAWINYKRTPALVVATFEDNQMTPNVFGWELKRQGGIYGYPFLIPEINNTGYATIAELINADYPLLYERMVKNKTTKQVQSEIGWKANTGTKFEVMGDFKTDWEKGDIEILDIRLLTEMKFFTKRDARLMNRQKGATRHFDLLRAAALAWHARKYVEKPILPEKESPKPAPEPVKASRYEGTLSPQIPTDDITDEELAKM